MIERLSVEVTNRCAKGCWFCYARSGPAGGTTWTADDLVGFALDCARGGVRAVSFGGGEPLEWPEIFEVLGRTRGALFRSMTTNGLALDAGLEGLVRVGVDKVHVSVHAPDRPSEVARVLRQVRALEAAGVRSGVNLVVAGSGLEAAGRAAAALREGGVGNDRIVYLPMRGRDTPSPEEVAAVAGGDRFQSMTCLSGCAGSPRFASVSWDRRVGWCSYTPVRAELAAPTHAALLHALRGLGLAFCGKGGEPPMEPRRLPIVPDSAVPGSGSRRV